jgi:hypothetical protein
VAGSAPAFADQIRQQEWWLSAVNVSQAWQFSRGGGVTVAVLNDGVDAAQADLGDAVTVGPDFTNAITSTSSLVGGTGTEIASLIAGRSAGAGDGLIGVAPKARILSIRVTLDPADPALDSSTIGAGLPDAIATGIRYAVAHHAKVIDLPADPGEPSPAQLAALPVPPQQTTAPQLAGITAAAGGSSEEQSAVAYARHKGVVLIAPAGDNGAGTDAANYPAAYPGVIAVGAFGQGFTGARYSSHQSYVALTGPGTDVLAADSAGTDTTISSTNAASAVVSGIAALIRSKYPSLTAAQVEHILTTSADYRTSGAGAPGQGSGTVDALRALATAAALKAPADSRAGAGAAPFASPAAPGIAAATSNGLAPRILRAAIISAALLVLLLLVVLAYRAVGRRRERKDAAAAAEWTVSTQNAFSPYGDQEADRMLEFFAAPTTGPAPPASPFAAAAGVGAHLRGRDETSAGGSVATAGGRPAGSESGGVGAWIPLGSAARAPSRQVRVSGTPPWEPAVEPDSELPWAAVPGAGTAPGTTAAGGRVASTSTTADSIWPTAAAEPATTTPAVLSPAAPSPSGRPWEDLVSTPTPPDVQSFTASGPGPDLDVPAPPVDGAGSGSTGFDTTAFDSTGSDSARSGPRFGGPRFGGTGFGGPRFDSAGQGSAGPGSAGPGSAGQSDSAGSPFDLPASSPRSWNAWAGGPSPSGLDWDRDAAPAWADEVADATDAHWQPTDSDPHWQTPTPPEPDSPSPEASASWLSSAAPARWRPDTANDPADRPTAADSGTHWTPTTAPGSGPSAAQSGPWPIIGGSYRESDPDMPDSSLPDTGLPGRSLPGSLADRDTGLPASGLPSSGLPGDGLLGSGLPGDGTTSGHMAGSDVSDSGVAADAPAPRPWSTDGTSGIFRWAPAPSPAEATRWAQGPPQSSPAQPVAESSWDQAGPDVPWSSPASDSSSSTPASDWSRSTPAPDPTWSSPPSDSSWSTPAPDPTWSSPPSDSSGGTPAPDPTWSTPASESSWSTSAPDWNTPATDSPWVSSDASSSWSTPAPDWNTPAPDWNAPPPDSGWESAGSRARRRSIDAQGATDGPGITGGPGGSDRLRTTDTPAIRNDPSDSDPDDQYAWRPGARTETFPALGDDN